MTSPPRLAVPQDVPAIAALLARAFDTDPLAQYLLPVRRPEALRTFHRVQMNAFYLPFGGVYTNEEMTGAALWSPPGTPQPKHVLLTLRPMWRYIRQPRKVIRVLAMIEANHPKEPHWYLATLGTEPTLQGKGIASALMAPILERCDREGMPAYLESSKERNIPLYRRYGFEVVRELQIDQSPTLWAMHRAAH